MTIYIETQDRSTYEKILAFMGGASLKCAGFTRATYDNGTVRIDEELFSGSVLRRKVTRTKTQGEKDYWSDFFSGVQQI